MPLYFLSLFSSFGLKLCGPRLYEDLAAVFAQFWPVAYGGGGQPIPAEWCGASVVGLWKGKGDPLDPANTRSIFLLDVAGKILSRLVTMRAEPVIEAHLVSLRRETNRVLPSRLDVALILIQHVFFFNAASSGG